MTPGLANYLVAPPALIATTHFGQDRQEITHRFLAEAFAQTASYRGALSQQQGLFEDFYRKVEASDDAPETIEGVADIVHDIAERSYREFAADFEDILTKARLYRRRRDLNAQSMARLGEEITGVCGAWYELYQNFEIRLRKLASDREPAPDQVFTDGASAARYLRSAGAG